MKLFRFTTLLMLVSFVCLITAFGQQRERIVQLNIAKNAPLRIVVIKVNNKPVNIREPFVADDDWLKGFSIEVENISPFPINYLEMELAIPNPPNTMLKNAADILAYGAFPSSPGIPSRVNPCNAPL